MNGTKPCPKCGAKCPVVPKLTTDPRSTNTVWFHCPLHGRWAWHTPRNRKAKK